MLCVLFANGVGVLVQERIIGHVKGYHLFDFVFVEKRVASINLSDLLLFPVWNVAAKFAALCKNFLEENARGVNSHAIGKLAHVFSQESFKQVFVLLKFPDEKFLGRNIVQILDSEKFV